MNRQKLLGEEKISKLLMQFSVPAIIGMMVNTLYNIVDRMYIGNIPEVGGLALTGVGITMPIMTIILAFGMLVGIGTSARISLKLGEHKRDEAEQHLGNAFTLILLISILIYSVMIIKAGYLNTNSVRVHPIQNLLIKPIGWTTINLTIDDNSMYYSKQLC